MKLIDGLFDKLFEQQTRQLAQRSSRRGMLKTLGGLLVGAGSIPLLPVARAAAAESPGHPVEEGDPASCDYWRYCAIDGFLCSCCGGSENTCPPGTEMSPVTWIGTCRNPADGRNYVIPTTTAAASRPVELVCANAMRGTGRLTARTKPTISTGASVLPARHTTALRPLWWE